MSFDIYVNLPQTLRPTSKEVMVFVGKYLQTDGRSLLFDWNAFTAALNGYKGDKLTFDQLKEKDISQNEATVSDMVDKISKYFKDDLHVAQYDSDTAALRANIEATFTNLQIHSETSFLSFSTSSSGHNSSWQYRILFACPDPNDPEKLITLVMTVDFTADIKEETSWFGLVRSSSKKFGAKVTTMHLSVTKGFKHNEV